jgi:hypothetical protein
MPKQSKTYKVVGTQPILEHAPGETFSGVIQEDLESFLIGIGGLEVVKAERASTSSAKASKSDR